MLRPWRYVRAKGSPDPVRVAAIRAAHKPFEGLLDDTAIETHLMAWPADSACSVCTSGATVPAWRDQAFESIAARGRPPTAK